MLRSLLPRVAAALPRLAALRVSSPLLTTPMLRPSTLRFAPVRAFASTPTIAAAPSSTNTAAATSTAEVDDDVDDGVTDDADDDGYDPPLTEEERNQADWEGWEMAKYNLYVITVMVCGGLLVRYWYRREKDHFLHHRHQQEPYAFFINKDDIVGAGFWPGRSCQFLELNSVYAAADEMLAEKERQKKEGGAAKKEEAHH